MCKHEHVTIFSKLLYHATREEPAEYVEWGVCDDCGKKLDISDIPQAEDAEVHEVETMRGMPHEHYD